MHSGAVLLRRISGSVLLATIAVAPLALASNRDWAWSPLALAVGISLVAFGLSCLLAADRTWFSSTSMTIAIASMAVVLAWGLVQTIPWGTSSRLASLFATVEAALGKPIGIRDVVDVERALTGLMRLAAYAGVFWLAAQLGRDRRYASAISLALIGSAVLVTLYGWAMEISARSCIVLYVVKLQLAHGDACTFSGTFVNSSNYADFASIVSLICLANLHDHLLQAGSSERGVRARWRARLMILTGVGAFYLAALVFFLGSVVYSASRAGLASFAIAAFVMTILTRFLNGERRGGLVGTTIGVSLVIAVALALGGEGVLRRSLALLSDQQSMRPDVYALTVNAISLHPWAGWGLGSFEPLYPIFQPTSLFLIFDKAHNTYLENALDLGIPVSLILLLAIAAPALRCARGLQERRRDTQFAAAAVGATVLVAVHSIVDFGIQIPAVAVAFAAVLGVGWAQSWSSRSLPTPTAMP